MKFIRVASDLHLEGFLGTPVHDLAEWFVPRAERDEESLLVLAGDISSKPQQLVSFVEELLPRFEKVLFVPGNHEYYLHNYEKWNIEVHELLRSLGENLFFVTEGVNLSDYDGVRFIYGTMWADGGLTPVDQVLTSRSLNDFRLITTGDGSVRFGVPQMREVFRQSKQSIDQALKLPFDGKKVVVTHHLPSRRLVSARFWPSDGSDGCNGGFVGDCESILAHDHAPALWIHGHTHDTIDTKLWETRIVCNPAGYRGEWRTPHNDFWSVENGRPFAVPKFVSLDEL
jgi:Icc-related predicted phosphoesterase